MDNDNYTYELEQALTKLLDFFDPEGPTYIIETINEELAEVSEELANAIDRANEVLYGETVED